MRYKHKHFQNQKTQPYSNNSGPSAALRLAHCRWCFREAICRCIPSERLRATGPLSLNLCLVQGKYNEQGEPWQPLISRYQAPTSNRRSPTTLVTSLREELFIADRAGPVSAGWLQLQAAWQSMKWSMEEVEGRRHQKRFGSGSSPGIWRRSLPPLALQRQVLQGSFQDAAQIANPLQEARRGAEQLAEAARRTSDERLRVLAPLSRRPNVQCVAKSPGSMRVLSGGGFPQ